MSRKLQVFFFTIDLRSLGLYRIFLGLLLISDWFLRWPDLEAFYTSAGVVPVEAPLPKPGGNFHFCLLDGVTSLPMVQTMFLLGLGCNLLFLVGYGTKLFQSLSFVFFLSVLSRTSMVRDGSVMVLASMLMWSLFLPMGKRFSLDALLQGIRKDPGGTDSQSLGTSSGRSEPSLAALALIGQIGLIYLFTAMAKHGETWKNGTALYYALNIDQIARPMGHWLASQSISVIKLLTWSVLGMEFAALPLIFLPFAQPWPRRIAIVFLSAMHLGIALTTTLTFFSVTMVASFALLLLPEDWAQIKCWTVSRRVAATLEAVRKAMELRIAQFPSLTLPRPIKADRENTSEQKRLASIFSRARFWTVNCIVAVLFVSFAVDGYNLNMAKGLQVERIPEPGWMRALIMVPLIQQDWELFAPDPTKDDGWWVIDGETEAGDRLDPLTGTTPTFEKPADLSYRFDRFWRKYLDRIWLKKNYDYRLYFGKYITRKDHRQKPDGQRLVRFRFYYVKEPTQPPGTPLPWPTERLMIWHHECSTATESPITAP